MRLVEFILASFPGHYNILGMRLVEFVLASFPGHYSILGMRLVECVILLLQVHKQSELADNVSLKQFLEGIILGRVEAVGEETITGLW